MLSIPNFVAPIPEQTRTTTMLLLLVNGLDHWTLCSLDKRATCTQFTFNRLDLSFSMPKVFLRSPLYQPIQKFLILAASNYLQICCF